MICRYGAAGTPPPNNTLKLGQTSDTVFAFMPRAWAAASTRSNTIENQQVVPEIERTS